MGIAYVSDRAMKNMPLHTPFAPGRALYRTNFPLTSDDIVGVTTLEDDGLTIGTWEGTTGSMFVEDGELRPKVPGVTGAVGLPLLGGNGAHVTMTVVQAPTGSSNLYLDAFREGVGLTQTNAYRVCIYPDNRVSILVRTGSGVGDRITPIFDFTPGDSVGIRGVGGVLTLLINHRPVIHVNNTDLPTANGYFVIANFYGSTGWSLDTLEVDVY